MPGTPSFFSQRVPLWYDVPFRVFRRRDGGDGRASCWVLEAMRFPSARLPREVVSKVHLIENPIRRAQAT